jgi:hypothetical protein
VQGVRVEKRLSLRVRVERQAPAEELAPEGVERDQPRVGVGGVQQA